MSDLPPRPESPSKEKAEQRRPIDDRDRRPGHAEFSAHRTERSYPQRPRGSDTYIAVDTRRREYDDRDRYRDRDWERERDARDREYRERERGSRYSPPRDRYYRGGRSPGGRYSPRRLSPSPRRDSYRPSRSPRRRRYESPPRRLVSPRRRSRSPPPKRVKIGQHSIDMSPQRHHDRSSPSRVPLDTVRRTHERGRSPLRRPRTRSPARPKRQATPPKETTVKVEAVASPKLQPQEASSLSSQTAPLPPESRPPTGPRNVAPVPPREPFADRITDIKQEVKHEEGKMSLEAKASEPPSQSKVLQRRLHEDESKANSEAFSAPPNQPKAFQSQPLAVAHARSPPRGPRHHSKGNLTPTGPAYHHLPGPQGQRRPPSAPASGGPGSTGSGPAIGDAQMIVESTFDEPKAQVPAIPPWGSRPSLTREIDTELTRLRYHRDHLATEYVTISKSVRRATYELEMASIELRAAEARRKYADSQLDKARTGVLGIDAVLAESATL